MKWEDILAAIPEDQVEAARAVFAEYAPALIALSADAAWAYVKRLLAGDLTAVRELLTGLSDDEFVARVKQNTARWQNIAAQQAFIATVEGKVIQSVTPILLSILLALVGL